MSKLEETQLPKDNLVVVFDNQPRNKEVCNIIEKTIDKNFKVVIWPQNIIQKDINEMVLSKIQAEKVLNSSICSGLEAKVKFYAWKRC